MPQIPHLAPIVHVMTFSPCAVATGGYTPTHRRPGAGETARATAQKETIPMSKQTVVSSWATRIQAAITESTREDRTETIYADDRQAFDWLAGTLEALAEGMSAEHTRDGDAVLEGWGTDPDNADMTWRVEIVLEGGAP